MDCDRNGTGNVGSKQAEARIGSCNNAWGGAVDRLGRVGAQMTAESRGSNKTNCHFGRGCRGRGRSLTALAGEALTGH